MTPRAYLLAADFTADAIDALPTLSDWGDAYVFATHLLVSNSYVERHDFADVREAVAFACMGRGDDAEGFAAAIREVAE